MRKNNLNLVKIVPRIKLVFVFIVVGFEMKTKMSDLLRMGLEVHLSCHQLTYDNLEG